MKKLMLASAPFNFIHANFDFAFLGVAKCGSTTLRHAFGFVEQQAKAVTRDVAMTMHTRLAVIRHPVERIVSAQGRFNVPWEDFWSVVRDNPHWDIHTAPYADTLGGDFTELYRLEDIDAWYPMLAARYPKMVRGLELRNRRKPPLPSNVPVGEIMEVYASDLALWEKVPAFRFSGAGFPST